MISESCLYAWGRFSHVFPIYVHVYSHLRLLISHRDVIINCDKSNASTGAIERRGDRTNHLHLWLLALSSDCVHSDIRDSLAWRPPTVTCKQRTRPQMHTNYMPMLMDLQGQPSVAVIG